MPSTHSYYQPNKFLDSITIKGQTYQLPMFLPDATLGVVRNLDSQDLKTIGINGVVINTYHLKDQPGQEVLQEFGGVKQLMSWRGLAASDSGGFQLFSLINQNPKLGKVTDQGVVTYSGKNNQHKHVFTPEDSIRIQFAINSDIMICLDDFTPDQAGPDRMKQSVARTIEWAERCKKEFESQLHKHHFSEESRPLLFAPIQGHRDPELRTHCARELQAIGFDGYGLGGWPFDQQGKFDYEMCSLNASLTPDDKPRFALGIGMPDNIVRLYQMGYNFFDCVLPTRDARHKRLYKFSKDPVELDLLSASNQNWYEFVYLDRGRHQTDQNPISPHCQCPVCQQYSRAYLHHLFKVKDGTAFRLAEIHNLSFYSKVIAKLKHN